MKSGDKNERRKLERFELVTPARIMIASGGTRKVEYSLTTRDLSSAGAFLYSSQAIPAGTSVKMEFLLSLDALRKIADGKGRARIKVRGTVLRSDPNGIAIQFSSGYKITALGVNGPQYSLP